jgi:hypothetical protein
MRGPNSFRRSYFLLGIVLVLLLACNSLPIFAPTVIPTSTVTPSPTNTPSPTITPTSTPAYGNWRSVLADNFLSNSRDWNLTRSTGAQGTVDFSIAGGVFEWLVHSVDSGGLMQTILAPIDALTDCYVMMTGQEIDAPAGAWYGLLIRSTSTSYYIFDIDQKGQNYSFLTNVSGSWEFPFTQIQESGIDPAGPNELAVRAEGGEFRLYINGAEVNVYHTGTIVTGQPGLVATVAETGNGTFNFTSFTVYAP